MIGALLDRLLPADALAWDEDRPFSEDWWVPRQSEHYEAWLASLPKIRDLLPTFRLNREPIVFKFGQGYA